MKEQLVVESGFELLDSRKISGKAVFMGGALLFLLGVVFVGQGLEMFRFFRPAETAASTVSATPGNPTPSEDSVSSAKSTTSDNQEDPDDQDNSADATWDAPVDPAVLNAPVGSEHIVAPTGLATSEKNTVPGGSVALEKPAAPVEYTVAPAASENRATPALTANPVAEVKQPIANPVSEVHLPSAMDPSTVASPEAPAIPTDAVIPATEVNPTATVNAAVPILPVAPDHQSVSVGPSPSASLFPPGITTSADNSTVSEHSSTPLIPVAPENLPTPGIPSLPTVR